MFERAGPRCHGFLLPLLAAGAAVVACQSMRMAVPADVAGQSELLPIANRGSATGSWADESFNFGPYRVADVDRKWNSSQGLGIGGLGGSSTSTTGYKFKFSGPGGEAQGTCGSELSSQQANVLGGSLGSQAGKLTCRCDGPGATADVTLLSSTSAPAQGQANAHGWVVNLVAVDRYENGMQSPDPTGYEARAGVVAGAVEVLRPGRVWLARPLDPARRADLACLFGGLLLFQPPRTHD
jgi:hypothetical protein